MQAIVYPPFRRQNNPKFRISNFVFDILPSCLGLLYRCEFDDWALGSSEALAIRQEIGFFHCVESGFGGIMGGDVLR